jgi:hypothetical protein
MIRCHSIGPNSVPHGIQLAQKRPPPAELRAGNNGIAATIQCSSKVETLALGSSKAVMLVRIPSAHDCCLHGGCAGESGQRRRRRARSDILLAGILTRFCGHSDALLH